MTNEKKLLLLIDLCGRLPHNVKGLHRGEVHNIKIIDANGSYPSLQVDGYDAWFPIETFKPYLRPISSITEEEINEYENFIVNEKDDLIRFCNELIFYNTHHFDYRGLIEKGLALEAKEGMYD